jgi:hypothetical protein
MRLTGNTGKCRPSTSSHPSISSPASHLRRRCRSVALLIEACLTAIALEIIVAWAALVVTAWACWTAIVTAGWLWQVAATRMRR